MVSFVVDVVDLVVELVDLDLDVDLVDVDLAVSLCDGPRSVLFSFGFVAPTCLIFFGPDRSRFLGVSSGSSGSFIFRLFYEPPGSFKSGEALWESLWGF